MVMYREIRAARAITGFPTVAGAEVEQTQVVQDIGEPFPGVLCFCTFIRQGRSRYMKERKS